MVHYGLFTIILGASAKNTGGGDLSALALVPILYPTRGLLPDTISMTQPDPDQILSYPEIITDQADELPSDEEPSTAWKKYLPKQPYLDREVLEYQENKIYSPEFYDVPDSPLHSDSRSGGGRIPIVQFRDDVNFGKEEQCVTMNFDNEPDDSNVQEFLQHDQLERISPRRSPILGFEDNVSRDRISERIEAFPVGGIRGSTFMVFNPFRGRSCAGT